MLPRGGRQAMFDMLAVIVMGVNSTVGSNLFLTHQCPFPSSIVSNDTYDVGWFFVNVLGFASGSLDSISEL